MTPASVDVSIIIVSWNVADLLRACLHSIYANITPALNVEVIVVDSASGDGTVERARAEFPQVMLLDQRDNVGFTKGNNIGLAAARGRLLFLLNPDTEIHEDAIATLAAYLDTHPEVGIVAPQTRNSDGTLQHTRRRFPSLALEVLDSLWFSFQVTPVPPSHVPPTAPPADSTHPVDWAQGSALMARREVYAQIGGLDETFFMFSEEVDWCKRAADAGWKIAYVGSTVITHHGGRSSEQVATPTLIYYHTSKVIYFRKHLGNLQADLLRDFIGINYAGKILIEWSKMLIGHKRAMRLARIAQYRQLLRALRSV